MAIRRDLIRLLAFSSTPCIFSKLSQDGTDVIRRILASTIMNSLAVRHVFLLVRKSVAKYKFLAPYLGDTAKDEVPWQLVRSKMRDVWRQLFASMRHFAKAFEAFAAERQREEVACGNANCTLRGLRLDFWKCAGCEVLYFCSFACQKIAWKTQGHREMCNGYQDKRAHSRISSLDAEYMARIARDGIRKTVSRTLTNARRCTNTSFDEHAILIPLVEEHRIASFGIPFSDWELAKQEVNPFVYRLYPEDTSLFKIKSRRRKDGLEDIGEEFVDVNVKVKYAVGSETRSIFFSRPFPRLFSKAGCAPAAGSTIFLRIMVDNA